jgi:hypothetical protein
MCVGLHRQIGLFSGPGKNICIDDYGENSWTELSADKNNDYKKLHVSSKLLVGGN